MKQKITTQELTMMALLAAILCVSSYINIPLPISPVPITAQILVVNLIALLLKPKKAALTVGVWLLLGAVGLPVFSGGRGGFGILAGPTGGYAFGYLLMAFVVAFLCGKCKKAVEKLLILIIVGIPIMYVLGVAWMKYVTGVDWMAAWTTGALAFLPGDIVKAVAAVAIAKPLYPLVANSRQERRG